MIFHPLLCVFQQGGQEGLLSISSHCCSFDRARLVKVKVVQQGRAIGELVACLLVMQMVVKDNTKVLDITKVLNNNKVLYNTKVSRHCCSFDRAAGLVKVKVVQQGRAIGELVACSILN